MEANFQIYHYWRSQCAVKGVNMEKMNQPGAQEILACETAPILREKEEKRPSVPSDSKDFWLAVFCTVLGFCVIWMFSSSGFARKCSVLTAGYVVLVLAYFLGKRKKPAAESWFWLAMTLGSGLPYGWYTAMPFLQFLGTAALAAYWTLTAGGCLMENGRTSQWAAADFWNSVWKVPFRNFGCYFHVMAGAGEEPEQKPAQSLAQNPAEAEGEDVRSVGEMYAHCGKAERRTKAKTLRRTGIRRMGSVLLGMFLAVPVLLVVLPLLSSADDTFRGLIQGFLEHISENVLIFAVRAVCSIPVTAYLFGAIYGCVHKRKTDGISRESVRRAGEHVRILSNTAVNTALLIVCGCYGCFLVLQGKYLFSAFAGIRPEAYTYAEYARKGFFELCAVAAVNLAVLLLANLFSKTERENNRALRGMNLLLSVQTLLLIATAMSKMLLYMSAYGLTVRRIHTMTFMIWLAVVFFLWCAGQKQKLPMIRMAVMSGAGLYVMLCVLPVEKIAEIFNMVFF